MQCDYLQSKDSQVHVINAKIDGSTLEAGILCLISCRETTIRISNDQHSFLIEVPAELRSSFERVKAFNVPLNILNHEQV